MSNSYNEPPPPNNRRILTVEEYIAVGVALLSVGLIFWWGLARPRVAGNPLSLQQTEADGSGAAEDGQSDAFEARPSRSEGAEETAQQPPAAAFSAWLARTGIQPSADLGNSQFEPALPRAAVATSPNTLFSSDLSPTVRDIDSSPRLNDRNLAETVTGAESGANPGADSGGVEALPNLPTESRQWVEPGPPLEFSDVPAGYWATGFIDALTARQVMLGYDNGTFRPDVPVTRAELASQIEGAFQAPNRQSAIAFSDISADYWARAKIQSAVETGFMRGYPEGDFQPDQAVPRVQVLVALVSGLGLDTPADAEAIISRYQDAEAIPAWAIDQVAAATQAGLVVNYPDPNQFQAERPATRAEVAAIMARALVFIGQLEDQPSEYVVK